MVSYAWYGRLAGLRAGPERNEMVLDEIADYIGLDLRQYSKERQHAAIERYLTSLSKGEMGPWFRMTPRRKAWACAWLLHAPACWR